MQNPSFEGKSFQTSPSQIYSSSLSHGLMISNDKLLTKKCEILNGVNHLLRKYLLKRALIPPTMKNDYSGKSSNLPSQTLYKYT